jgi:hypothetical protein
MAAVLAALQATQAVQWREGQEGEHQGLQTHLWRIMMGPSTCRWGQRIESMSWGAGG